MNKPMTLERFEYMKQIVAITNSCKLPAAFKADVLESALSELRALAEQELKRDMETYHATTDAQGGADHENQ